MTAFRYVDRCSRATGWGSPGRVRRDPGRANSDLGLLNLLGNVVMFAPIGFLTPMATRLRFGEVVTACLVLSVGVELLQLVLAVHPIR